MTRKSSRKSRFKKKKLKYLSLRSQLSTEKTIMRNSADHALNLNLYPQNQAEDEAIAADLFSAAMDGGAATLTALLGGESPSNDNNTQSPSLTCTTGAPDSLSPSLTCVNGALDSEESALFVRTAMKNKGKGSSEEKWVCYEEVTSCASDLRVKVHPRGLLLKLDYEDIMDAWSDKGPLHVAGPQTVPDDFLYGLNAGFRSNGTLWAVPENTIDKHKVKGEQNLEEELKIQHREASVLRYKEKRQNRLFSKRIRYQVRKINAEKRPRTKGRFVKRS